MHSRIFIHIYTQTKAQKHTHTHAYIYIYIYISQVKLTTVVKGDLKAAVSIAITPRSRKGRRSFSWIVSLYP